MPKLLAILTEDDSPQEQSEGQWPDRCPVELTIYEMPELGAEYPMFFEDSVVSLCADVLRRASGPETIWKILKDDREAFDVIEELQKKYNPDNPTIKANSGQYLSYAGASFEKTAKEGIIEDLFQEQGE